MHLPASLRQELHSAGSVNVPEWFLPAAAVACYSLPLMILFLSGDMDKDNFKRARTGVTLKQRAVGDFVNGLERGLQRIGVLAKPVITARLELGYARSPHPPPQRDALVRSSPHRVLRSPGREATCPPSP